MKQSEIFKNNEKCMEMWELGFSIWDSLPTHGRNIRFRHCEAWVQAARTDTHDFDMFVLTSYDTVVAFVFRDHVNKTVMCVDMLRYVYGYTATSAQHISKFFYDMGEHFAKVRGYGLRKYRYEALRK